MASLRKSRRLGWIIALCAFVALIVAVAILYLRPPLEERLVQFEVATVPRPVFQSNFAPLISPDGRYIAYQPVVIVQKHVTERMFWSSILHGHGDAEETGAAGRSVDGQ
jgi:hypothetical protein